MPSVSEPQAHLMAARAHGWNPPGAKHLPPVSVAKEFHEADKKVGKWEHPLHKQRAIASALRRGK
jgi:hypothetical protein